MCKLSLYVLLILICACDSGQEPAQSSATPASTSQVRGKATHESAAPVYSPADDKEAVSLPAPSFSQIQKADRLLAYSNAGLEYLDRGFYSLADTFHANSQRYLETFKLPPRPKIGARRDMKPEAGLFDEQEMSMIANGLAGMDKALNSLLGHYASLEKYVADKNIRDDGDLGRKLAAQIAADHSSFIAARKTWLDIVQARASEAEKIMLHEHPLKRQILVGSAMLNQMREVASLLASEQAQLLPACRKSIADYLSQGEKPPFPAKAALERLYRIFLNQARNYLACLERGMNEGFHQPQRKELNQASQNCAAAWNEFVKAANSG